MSELLTIKGKFEKYKDREFTIHTNDNRGITTKVKIIIKGYVKESNKFLIGLIVKNQGIYPHFKSKKMLHFIDDYSGENDYMYVSLRMLEKYPVVKEVRKRKDILEDIDNIDFKIKTVIVKN